jgi:transcriptional regulator GlxA family with amidase domain
MRYVCVVDSPRNCIEVKVGILLFYDVEEMDFSGPLEVFGVASSLTGQVEVVTVSKDGKPVRCRYGLKVQPDLGFANCPQLDLLIIPGGKGARTSASKDAATLSFARGQAERAEIASVCTGAMVLAEAGILKGHRATAHHEWTASLQRYPGVEGAKGVRYVREGRVSTSAGVSAGIDLALAIVRDLFGNGTAEEVAKIMEYEKVECRAQKPRAQSN